VADAIYGHTGPRCFGEDGRHLAMFPGRDAIVHLTPEVNDTVYRDSAIVDLRPGWREPLALTNRKLIRLHQDSAVPIPLDREISVHPAVVAETARYLWVGGSDTTGFAVELFAKHEGGHGASFTRSFSLPAPALLAASATSEDNSSRCCSMRRIRSCRSLLRVSKRLIE
jgi:hypothetical protein